MIIIIFNWNCKAVTIKCACETEITKVTKTVFYKSQNNAYCLDMAPHRQLFSSPSDKKLLEFFLWYSINNIKGKNYKMEKRHEHRYNLNYLTRIS